MDNEMIDADERPALTLPAFLRLRALEETGVANAALPHWPEPGTFVGGVGQFLDKFNPARMRHEVGARLAIVDAIEAALDKRPGDAVLLDVLRQLATPYTGHPYYRDEWQPDGMPSTPGGNTP